MKKTVDKSYYTVTQFPQPCVTKSARMRKYYVTIIIQACLYIAYGACARGEGLARARVRQHACAVIRMRVKLWRGVRTYRVAMRVCAQDKRAPNYVLFVRKELAAGKREKKK